MGSFSHVILQKFQTYLIFNVIEKLYNTSIIFGGGTDKYG